VRVLAAFVAVAALAALKPGAPAKEFSIPVPGGKTYRLADFKGKVVILEFLLTHCPACQNTGRLLQQMQDEYGPRGFQALGVAVDAQAATGMANYLNLTTATFPIGIRTENDFKAFAELSAFEVDKFPEIFVIDRAGVVRWYHGAPGDEAFLYNEERLLRSEVEMLLAAKPALAGGKTK